eukprot:403351858
MMLDKEKLEALEEEFAEHPEGLELENFVWLMKSAMQHTPEEEYDLVHGLCKLFNEIDINGDQHMEWKEFTQYIIDAVMQNQVALENQKDNEKEAKHLEQLQTGEENRELTEVQRLQQKIDLLEQAESFKLPRFYISKQLDKAVHLGHIQKAIFCQRFDMILTMENMQKELKLYSTDCKLKIKLEPQFKREAFILSCAYDDEKGVFGCVASDSCMYFWESQLSQLNVKFLKSLNAPCIQTGIWFLPKHKTWVTAGKDNVIREWDIWKGSTADCLLVSFEDHKKDIMDVCEIHSPLAIATASFDKTIRIFNLQEKIAIGVLKEHKKGVRSLNYTPYHGGNILSVGHENYINVWSPEGSINRSHIGKLEGHNAPVVSAKFINQTPFCVSVDEKMNVRIWDIRTLQCQQIISYESKSKLPVQGLLILPQTRKFAVLSKRFIFYDTISNDDNNIQSSGNGGSTSNQSSQIPNSQGKNGQSLENAAAQIAQIIKQTQQNPQHENLFAIDTRFNEYYRSFVVITKNEIRTYDGLTGKLIKVFSEVIDKRTNAELSAFCLDNRHRKCYLGDTAGSIRVFNVSNGVFIKHVNHEDDNELRHKRNQLLKKDKAKEISNLEFVNFNENLMLLSTTWDSKLKVFDEEDPDETFMLRKSTGGHFKDDISALAFNDHLSLIATGSRSGIICIWDFETNKLEGICLGQKRAVTSLSFMKEYPLLVSAGQCGIVCIWGIRPCPYEVRNVCLGRFINLAWDGESFTNIGITSIFVKIIENSNNDKEIHSPPQKYSRTSTVINTKQEDDLDELQKKCEAQFIQEAYETEFDICNNEMIEMYETEFNKVKEDNDQDEGIFFNKSFNNHFKQFQPPKFQPDRPKCFLIFGDEKGFIKQWDISVFLHNHSNNITSSPPYLTKVPSMTDKLSYNAKRKQKIDASNIAPSHLQTAKEQKLPPILDAKQCIQIKEYKGHKLNINSVKEIQCAPYGFMTTSMDKHVKIWSLFGKLWGDIYLIKENYDKNWCFPFNWKSIRNNEVEQAKKVLSSIRDLQVKSNFIEESQQKPFEEVEEVVEFDDELEQVLREQQRKLLMSKMLQNKQQQDDDQRENGYFSKRNIVQQQQQQKTKQNQNQGMSVEAVPQYYVTATHPLIAKDFGQTEDYKRKIKRMCEGPAKFYTGFVFDLEQDLLTLEARQKEMNAHKRKNVKSMTMHKASMSSNKISFTSRGGGQQAMPNAKLSLISVQDASSNNNQQVTFTSNQERDKYSEKESASLSLKQRQIREEEQNDAVASSKYQSVAENLKNKYLEPLEKFKNYKDPALLMLQQKQITIIDQDSGQKGDNQNNGWLTQRIERRKSQLLNGKQPYNQSTDSKAGGQMQKQLSLKNLKSLNYDKQSTTTQIPQYAMKASKQLSRIQYQQQQAQTSVNSPNQQKTSNYGQDQMQQDTGLLQTQRYSSAITHSNTLSGFNTQRTIGHPDNIFENNAQSTSLLQQIVQNKQNSSQRRLIIGFEANKNTNGNFLRKLDRMISVSSRPKSRVSSHVEDIKYAPGEGIKQMAKAVSALNDKKYSEVNPFSSTQAIDNKILLQSRIELKSRVEQKRITNNKVILKERDRRMKEVQEMSQQPNLYLNL